MERDCLSDFIATYRCPQVNGTSLLDCSTKLAGIGTVERTLSQQIYGEVVSTGTEYCLQVSGVPNDACDSTSIFASCQSSQSFNVLTCPMRLFMDGSCVELHNTSAYNVSTLSTFGGGCVALDDDLMFGCDERFTSDCVLANGTAAHNCSTICNTPSLLLENFYTFEYCAPSLSGFPSIAKGVTYNASMAIYPIINACMQQYCEDPFTGLGGQCPWSNLSALPDYLASMCIDVVTTGNLDIAGAGILISYLLQISITLITWALLRSMELFRSLLHFRLAAQIVFHYNRYEKFLSLPLEEPVTRQLAVIRSMFVEFQEAQCFFILATQIATAFVLSKGLILLDSYSIVQLQANKIILLTVAKSGIAAAGFGLLILHLANMASLYMVVLSSGAVIIALRNIIVAMRNISVLGFMKPPGFVSSPNCGQGPPPIAYCSDDMLFTDNVDDFVSVPTVASSSIQDTLNAGVTNAVFPIYPFAFILVLILLSRRETIALIRSWSKRLMERTKIRSRFPLQEAPSPALISVLVASVRLIAFILELMMIVLLGSYVRDFVIWQQYNLADMSSWNFGQIVALFVWAPIISKYLYWTLFGIEEHSDVRIARPYRIVRSEERPLPRRADRDGGGDRELNSLQPSTGTSTTDESAPESQVSLLFKAQQAAT